MVKETIKKEVVEKPMTPHEQDEAERMKTMVDKAKADQKLVNKGNRFGQ